ncbi:DoxX family protein [Streptomyces sp. VRA16 Mangrove soil]|uniref:DoxX family protein n=1 Tax=Streptomyces sp. VRA16 Mangrove soil TaxID=2817434 RepID=UPI001A9F767F|nr:DoxX family protein [Streptomyces sp. VRA16 Mangrove soil]MBO1331438.1 DoxX family protein [Streptomyces sp. VRA16 Mangrove soil]
MAVLRKYARPMLASVFVAGGLKTVRAPERVAPAAEPVAGPVASRVPKLPDDPEQLVRLNGAVHIGAGLLLATGVAPRFAALALAGTLVPTTLAGHAWWKEKDPERRAEQRTHFLKNASLFGGLLIAAADTHGKPSVAYRARGAAAKGRTSASRMRRDTTGAVRGLRDRTTGAVHELQDRAQQAVTR